MTGHRIEPWDAGRVEEIPAKHLDSDETLDHAEEAGEPYVVRLHEEKAAGGRDPGQRQERGALDAVSDV